MPSSGPENRFQDGASSQGCAGRVRGEDAGSARIRSDTGATEDAASRRPARPCGTATHSETGSTRLLVVLGYSDGREDALHPVCAARVAYAAGLAGEGDAVLLSGWARRHGRTAEAELMRRAWRGPAVALHCDEEARITAENAVHAARRARALGVREVVVVTSSWHRARARVLFRALLPELPVTVVGVPAGGSLRHVLREAAVFPLVPLQVARARRRAGEVSGRSAAAA